MADVKRYEKRVNPINGDVYMACVPDGAYVLYSDYAALSQPVAEAVDGLERIDGMTFMLHENPDDENDDPVRLVMAMSFGNTVFCHRASQGDNGICRDTPRGTGEGA